MCKKLIFVIFLLSSLKTFAQYPEASITNGEITAKLYLPDPKNGFYRASRFDWAGVVSSLKYKDHQYFGQWYTNHDPNVHDAIQGPVEAFDPIGYEDAKPGETFINIGVGTLRKINSNPYGFYSNFVIVNGGVWKVRKKKDRVEFSHELFDENGYAYVYKKTLRLVHQKPELILEHSLKNTGKKIIETSTFNHNFFMIDKQVTGPDFTVSLPFDIESKATGKDLIMFKNKQIRYLKDLKKGESTMEYPKGFSEDKIEDYDILIENKKTGGGVRITADRPLSNFKYWSISTTLCPEPYIKIKVLPGEEFKWNIKYQFYTNK